MSAGLRGTERARRVKREEYGGEMEWVWRLKFFNSRVRKMRELAGQRVRNLLEDVCGRAMFTVDEGFGLCVAICGDEAIVRYGLGSKSDISRYSRGFERHCE